MLEDRYYESGKAKVRIALAKDENKNITKGTTSII